MPGSFDEVADPLAPSGAAGGDAAGAQSEGAGTTHEPIADDADLELALEFAKIARDIQGDSTAAETFAHIVELAVATVDAAEHAAVTVVRGGKFETVASTDEVCRRVDQIQYDTSEGPCVESMTDNRTYRSNDLRSEPRFARFASRTVAETGVLSMLSFRLFTEEDTFGALNLYATRTDAFDEQSLTIGAIFATHAALAFDRVHEHEENENLERALATNREIAMAMGIVMADRRCTEQQAFTHLREVSQRLNRKLRDIAADVVRTGEIPTDSGNIARSIP